jgi:hypothetical protein
MKEIKYLLPKKADVQRNIRQLPQQIITPQRSLEELIVIVLKDNESAGK